MDKELRKSHRECHHKERHARQFEHATGAKHGDCRACLALWYSCRAPKVRLDFGKFNGTAIAGRLRFDRRALSGASAERKTGRLATTVNMAQSDEPPAAKSATAVELEELTQRGSVSGASSSLRQALEGILSGKGQSNQGSSQPSKRAPAAHSVPPPPPPPPPLQVPGNEVSGRRPGAGRRNRSRPLSNGGIQAMPSIAAVAIAAALIAVGTTKHMALAGSPREQEVGAMYSQLLRTNSDIFSGALQDATARADGAVVERERTASQLSQCLNDLKARDEYIEVARPEMRRLRSELIAAKEALVRVEVYFGAAAVVEAQQHRGWLQKALDMGADIGTSIVGEEAVASAMEVAGLDAQPLVLRR